jgi:hypothetical protein
VAIGDKMRRTAIVLGLALGLLGSGAQAQEVGGLAPRTGVIALLCTNGTWDSVSNACAGRGGISATELVSRGVIASNPSTYTALREIETRGGEIPPAPGRSRSGCCWTDPNAR